ncbi:MAG TPA: hypothetical protein VF755_19305, partial [Catenuloplanes sp.]
MAQEPDREPTERTTAAGDPQADSDHRLPRGRHAHVRRHGPGGQPPAAGHHSAGGQHAAGGQHWAASRLRVGPWLAPPAFRRTAALIPRPHRPGAGGIAQRAATGRGLPPAMPPVRSERPPWRGDDAGHSERIGDAGRGGHAGHLHRGVEADYLRRGRDAGRLRPARRSRWSLGVRCWAALACAAVVSSALVGWFASRDVGADGRSGHTGAAPGVRTAPSGAAPGGASTRPAPPAAGGSAGPSVAASASPGPSPARTRPARSARPTASPTRPHRR